MKLAKLVRHKKRRGRGIGGRGAKSGRGMKGQKSRAGYHRKAGFEGGQTPLYMRLPKGRGTKQKFPSQIVPMAEITTAQLNQFAAGSIVGLSHFTDLGLLGGRVARIKLIGNKPVTKKLTMRVHAATRAAEGQVVAAGGKVELITT